MIILPAIDIQNGECVRLYRGDFATAHKVAEDPLETAGSFYRDGAGGSIWWIWTAPEPGGGKMRLFS